MLRMASGPWLAGLLTLAVGFTAASPVEAQTTYTWTQTGTSGPYNWSGTGNWLGGNVASGTDAVAAFNAPALTAPFTVTLDSGFTVGSLVFDNPSNNFGWTITGTNSLTLATSTGTPTITVDNPNITATIGVVLTGAQGLNIAGPGTTVLTQANTYAGNTAINAGALLLNFNAGGATSNILPSTNVTIGSATLALVGTNSATNTQTINGLAASGGATAVVTNVTLFAGNVTRVGAGTLNILNSGGSVLALNLTTTNGIVGGGWLSLSGSADGQDWAVSNGGAITAYASYVTNTWAAANNTRAGNGAFSVPAGSTTNSLQFANTGSNYTLTLTGANTIASGGIMATSLVGFSPLNGVQPTITGAGSLTSGNGTDLVISQYNWFGTLTIAAQITGSIGLTQSGTGETIISSTTNNYTGATTVNSNILLATNPGALPGYTTSGLVVVQNSGTLAVSAGATSGQWVSTNIDNLLENGVFNTGSALGIDVSTGNSFTYGSNISGALGFTKLDAGTLTLTGTSSYTGVTTIAGGTLSVGTLTIGGVAGPIGAATNAPFNLVLTTGGTLQYTGTGLAATTDRGANLGYLGGGVAVSNLGTTLTLSGNILGIGSFTTTGPGTVALSGVNTYSGGTVVNSGTLSFTSASSAPTGGLLSVAPGATVLFASGISPTVDGLNGSGTIQFGSASTLTIGSSFNSGTFSGVITNPTTGILALVKNGSGTQILTGANTFSGGVTVNAGMLSIAPQTAAANPLGAGPVTLGGGTLDFRNYVAVATTGYNKDLIFGVQESSAPLNQRVSGAFDTVNQQAFFQVGMASAGGLPVNGSIKSATNTATLFLLQPATSTNALGLNPGQSGTISLTSPGSFSTLALFVNSSNGSSSFNVTLNYSNSTSTTFSGQSASDWFGGANSAIGSLGRYLLNTGTFDTGSATGGNPNIYQVSLSLSTADQAKTLTSITIADTTATTANSLFALWGVSGISATAPTSLTLTNPTTVTANSTVSVTAYSLVTLGTLGIGANSLTVTGSSGSSLNYGAVTLSGSATFSPASGVSLSLGSISDGGSGYGIGMAGAGTLILTGAGNYSGTTTISSGILQVVNGGSLGSGNVVDSGTLAFNLSGTTTVTGNISGTGGVTQLGSGTTTLAGSNSYTGTTTVSNGTLALPAGAVVGSTTVIVGNTTTAATLELNGSATIGTAASSMTVGGGKAGGAITFSNAETSPSTLTIVNTSANTALTLGSTGPATLNINFGSASADQIITAGKLVVGGAGATINIAPLTGVTLAPASYTLLGYGTSTAPTGLALGVVSPGAGFVYALSESTTAVTLAIGAGNYNPSVNSYWTGSQSGNWSTGIAGGASNFVQGPSGSTDAGVPGSSTNVYFSATSASLLTSTIDMSLAINSLNFTGTGTPGTGATVINGSNMPLTIVGGAVNGNTSGSGLTVAAGAGAVSIGAPITLAGSQTWSSSSANGLTISGAITGAANLTIQALSTGGVTLSGGVNNFGGVTNSGLGAGAVTISSVIGANVTAVVQNSATSSLILTGTNTYTAPTTVTSGTLQVGNGAGAGSIASTSLATIASAGTLEFYSNSGSLTFPALSGTGTLYFLGTNTVSNTGVSATSNSATVSTAFTGTLVLNDARYGTSTGPTVFGGISSIVIMPGGQLGLFAGGTYGISVTMAGNGWYDNTTTASGAIRFQSNAIWSGNITMTANSRVSPVQGTSSQITGTIFGTGYQLEIGNGGTNGTGTLTLTPPAANQFSALLLSTSGNVIVAGNANAFPTTVPAALTMNGATLSLNGFSFSFANLSGTTGIIRDNSATTASVITIGSSSDLVTTSYTYGGTIVNGSTATLGLTKVGLGTLILTGANTYTGPTLINGGVLQIGGTAGAITSAVTVGPTGTLSFARSGTFTLSAAVGGTGAISVAGPGIVSLTGSNSFSGSVSITGGTLSLGSPASIGAASVAVSDTGTISFNGITPTSNTVTLTSLTLGSATGSNIVLNFNGFATTTPAITVTNTSGLILVGNTTLSITNAAATATGEVPLIAYTSPTQITSGLVFQQSSSRAVSVMDYSNYNATTGAGLIQLNVVSSGAIKWIGNVNSNWDVGTAVGTGGTFNWQLVGGTGSTNFFTGDKAVFDDTASGTGAVSVTVAAAVQPSSVTFNNSTRAYTLTGTSTNLISGAATLSVLGSGTVTLASINSYTGGTSVTSGTLNANAATALGSGPIVVNGGTLNANASVGTGSITLSSGQLNINTAAALGSGAVTITGGTISNTSGAAVTVSSTAAATWGGNFTFGGNNALNLGIGPVTLTVSPTITTNLTNALTVGGVISGSFGIVKSGPGTLQFNAAAPSITNATWANSVATITIGSSPFQVGQTVTVAGITGQTGFDGTYTITTVTPTTFSYALTTQPTGTLGFASATATGANTYTGTTTVSQGTLILNSNTTADTTGYILGDVNTGSNNLTLGFGSGFNTGTVTPAGQGYTVRQINVTASNQGTGTKTIDITGATGIRMDLILTLNSAVTIKGPAGNDQLFAVISGPGAGAGNTSLTLDVNGGTFVWTNGSLTGTTPTPNSFVGNVHIINSSASPGILQMQNIAYASATAGFQNLMIPDTSSVTIDPNVTWRVTWGVETIDALNGFGSVNFQSNGNNIAGPTLTVGAGNGNGSYGGVIAGNGFSLGKTGTGTQVLTGVNAYTGGTFIQNGILQIGTLSGATVGNLPSGSTVTLGNGATSGILQLGDASNPVSQILGSIVVSGGTANAVVGGNSASSTLNINTAGALTVNLGGAGTNFNNVGLTFSGTGTLTVSGTNTYTGPTTIQTGTLQAGSTNALGASPLVLGSGTSTTGTLDLNGFTVGVTGLSTATTGIGSASSNIITNNGSTSATLEFSTGTSTFGGTIQDGAQSVALTVSSGSLTLSGTNNYSGPTTIAGGKLRIQSGSITSGAAVTVSDPGTLSIFGITPSSTPVTLSTLTVGSSSGATLGFEFNGSPTTAPLNVSTSGGLTLIGNSTVNISDLLPLAVGEIPLISYSGAQITSGLHIGTLPNARTLATIDYTTVANLIQLKIIGTDTIIWTGAVSNVWDVGTSVNVGGTNNWKLNSNGNTTNFVFGDGVTFNDTASGTGAVSITISPATVNPSSVTFKNTTRAYAISGGAIADATAPTVVTLTGGGTVTLSSANTYSGGTVLTSGQLNINASGTGSTSSAIGTGSLTIGAGTTISNTSGSSVTLGTNNVQFWNGNFTFGGNNPLNLGTGGVTLPSSLAGSSLTLTLNGASPLTVGGAITDLGNNIGITVAGTGALVLSGNNVYTGPMVVNSGTLTLSGSSTTSSVTLNAGTLNINGANALGTGLLTISSGTTIDNTSGAPVTVAGNNSVTINGNFTFKGTNALNTGTGPISLTSGASTTITVTSASNPLTLGGALSDAGAGITKAGPGTLILAGVSTFSGPVNINNGTLIAQTLTGSGNSLGSGGTITLAAGTTLAVYPAGAVAGFGGNIAYSGTTSGNSIWQINSNGITSTPVTNNVLTLTDGGGGEARSAFVLTPISTTSNFIGSFVYKPNGGGLNSGADGVTFTIQNSAAGASALGAGGGSLGYAASITPSLALQFNIYQPNTIGYSVATNGAIGANTPYPFNASGLSYTVNLAYNATTNILSGSITDPNNVVTPLGPISENLSAILGSSTGYIGFTGGTGGVSSIQTISNVAFASASTLTYSNPVVIPAGLAATVGVVAQASGVVTGLGPLTLGSASTLNVAAGPGSAANAAYTLTFSGLTLNGANTITVANNGTGQGTVAFLGTVADGTPAGGTLLLNGAGAVTLGAPNTYTGNTNLASGQLNINSGSALSTGSLFMAAGTALDNTSGTPVNLGTSTPITWAGNLTFNGSNALDLGTGNVTMGSSLTVTANGSSALSLDGVLGDGGHNYGLTVTSSTAGQVFLTPTSGLVLNGVNTYTGPTTINGASLTVGPSGQINSNNLTVNAILVLNNAAQTVANLNGSSTGVIYLNGAALTVNQTTPGAYAGYFFGTGSLTLSPASTNLTLSGLNFGSGGINVQGGTLVSQSVFSLGTGPVKLSNGATLSVAAPVTPAQPSIVGFGASSTLAGNTAWTVNSNVIASIPITNNVLTLTDGGASESRSAFSTSPISTVSPFSAVFTWVPNGTADGISFTIQNDTRGLAALGGTGGGLGLGSNNGGTAITPSVSLALNIYNGAPGGTGYAFTKNGVIPVNVPYPLSLVQDGSVTYTIDLNYYPSQSLLLGTIAAGNSAPVPFAPYFVNLASVLGSSTGFVGFTGATGGLASTLSVGNFSFTGVTAYSAPVAVVNGATSTILAAVAANAPTISMNTLTLGSGSTLDVAADPSTPANQAYGLVFGAVTLNGIGTVNVSNNGSGLGTVTFGAIADGTSAGTLIKTGAGSLIASAPSTFTGSTQINAGLLSFVSGGLGTGSITFTGNSTLQWATGNTQDVSSVLKINDGVNGTIDTNGNNVVFASPIGVGAAGTGALTKTGAGTLYLTAPNTYKGGTTILNGALNINSDSALGAAASVVNLTGGTLQFAAGGGVTVNSSRSIVLGGGAFDTNSGNDTINGVISGADPVNSNLIKNGAGDLSLTRTNTYAGSTIVNAGGLVVGSTASLGSGPLMVNNTNPAPSSTDVYLYNTAGQTVGTLSSNLSGAASGNAVGVFLSTGVILTVNQTAPTTFQGTIFGGGSLVLGSLSTSTLTLTGNSTYGGSTTVNGGTLQLGVANALPATTPLTLGVGGTLNLNNNNQTIAALNTSAGNINTGTGTGGILTIGNTAGGTATYSGVISGTGGLTWGIVNTNVPNPTPSTLLLTNTSTNTGPMTINTGTLSIGTAYALSGGVAPVLPYSPSNTYPGAFTLGPTATLLTNGFNLTVGSLGGGGPIGGNINLGNNSSSTLYIVQSSSTGYAGIISGTGNVYIVNGVNLAVYGNWTLTGGVTHDVTNLQGNHTDSPKSYLPFAIAGNSAVTTQGINFAGFTDQVSTIFGGSSADNNAAGTFVDTGSGGKLVLSYYAASVSAGGPSNGLGGNQTFSGFFMNDVGLIFDAGYWGTAQQMTLSGPNNTTGPLTIGFTNQTTPQFGACHGRCQSGVAKPGHRRRHEHVRGGDGRQFRRQQPRQ